MYYTGTATATRTNTYTEARVRYVMDKVLEDFVTVAVRGFVTFDRMKGWYADVQAVLLLEAADFFELQLSPPKGDKIGVRYRVIDDGSISEDEASGGQNLYWLPNGTTVGIVIRLREGAKKKDAALAYLKKRGWAMNGTVLRDDGVRDRGYSKDGYGVRRERVGSWQ